MAKQARVKVTLTPYERELLQWSAEMLGLPPASYAAQLLAECLTRVLDDQAVRREWTRRRRLSPAELEALADDAGDDPGVAEIRDVLAVGGRTR